MTNNHTLITLPLLFLTSVFSMQGMNNDHDPRVARIKQTFRDHGIKADLGHQRIHGLSLQQSNLFDEVQHSIQDRISNPVLTNTGELDFSNVRDLLLNKLCLTKQNRFQLILNKFPKNENDYFPYETYLTTFTTGVLLGGAVVYWYMK